MRNPFDTLTHWSIDRPKSSIAAFLTLVLFLSMFVAGPIPESLGVGIEFDNSEDAFYPDRRTNEDVDLLYEIEETYTSSIDIVRLLVEFEKGDLNEESTWMMLADLEAEMHLHSESTAHRLDTGAGSVLGPASAAYGWSMMVDPNDVVWLDAIDAAIFEVFQSTGDNISSNLDLALNSTLSAPMTMPTVNATNLRTWSPADDWLNRLDSGENRTNRFEATMGSIIGMNRITIGSGFAEDDPQLAGKIAAVQGAFGGIMGFHSSMQDIPYRDLIIASLPSKELDGENFVEIPDNERWNRTDLVSISMFIDTDLKTWGESVGWDSTRVTEDELAATKEIDAEVENWTLQLTLDTQNIAGTNATVAGISFAHFSNAQTADVGKEIGQLLGMSVLLLTIILFSQFRTGRDTALVLASTILGILGTYGISGILNLTFNAAMNSIPILLIAIGVDYGIHVVARYREILREEGEKTDDEYETLRDFPKEIRIHAIRRGAILTSGALLIAIFTDMVGFLSFRFSSQKFLVDFGTVIAVGLFMIYLLSVTLLPAMLSLMPPAKLRIKKAARIEPGPISNRFGSLTSNPFQVLVVALILSVPVGYGITSLEVGFDTRDQLDDSIPAVENFLILADRYEASPAPIYVQYIPISDLFSSESWKMIGDIEETVRSTEGSSEVSSLRSTLESSANTDSVLDDILQSITDDPTNQSNWDTLSSWVMNNETGREITARYVPDEGGQTVIQFSAATVDWSDTVDFEERLTTALDELDGEGEMGVAGRPLILAQVTEGVASAAVLSTLVVASVILFMLIGLQSVEKRDKKRAFVTGLFMWIPLGMVVVWVYGLMGILGYQLNAQTVTIGALTLGLGVDYAVHYAHRYEEERLASPTSTPDVWVARTTVTTGRAMAGAAITTAGGFAVLNLSGLAPLRLFGQVFLVAILLALISSLVLLPVLFSLRPGEREVNLVTESE
ncbi:MAG: hypothetical protein CMA29_06380 [Euryarchaeota archaeon]|nr:hypothetical protein [Euryarchaeota archaeon]